MWVFSLNTYQILHDPRLVEFVNVEPWISRGDPQLRRNQGPHPMGISQGSAASPPLLGRDCVDLLISLWRTAFGFMECFPLFSFYFYQYLFYLLFFLLALDLFCSFSRLLKYKQGIWDLFFILLLIFNAISCIFHSVQNIFLIFLETFPLTQGLLI